jgi:hypothetical protein
MKSSANSRIMGRTGLRRIGSSAAALLRMFVTCFSLQTLTSMSPGLVFLPTTMPA